eukprot:3949671-Pleurochrysis_carterae.AAC.4
MPSTVESLLIEYTSCDCSIRVPSLSVRIVRLCSSSQHAAAHAAQVHRGGHGGAGRRPLCRLRRLAGRTAGPEKFPDGRLHPYRIRSMHAHMQLVGLQFGSVGCICYDAARATQLYTCYVMSPVTCPAFLEKVGASWP